MYLTMQPNQEAIERIKAARGRSLKLMQLDADGSLSKIAENKRNGIDESLTSTNSSTESLMTKRPKPSASNMQAVRRPNSSSKLPREILESFKQNPIDESMLYGSMDGGGSLSMLNEDIPIQQPKAVESTQVPIVQQVASAQIDYPMIRTIVEDVVRKYTQALNKKIVNENKAQVNLNEVNTVTLGKSFKFLAKNGDIYEAKLTKIGNINDKRAK